MSSTSIRYLVISLLVLVTVLAGLFYWNNTELVERKITTKASNQVTYNALYTAEQLLKSSGYRTTTVLDLQALKQLPQHTTLIVVDQEKVMQPELKASLDLWLSKGGHLVLFTEGEGKTGKPASAKKTEEDEDSSEHLLLQSRYLTASHLDHYCLPVSVFAPPDLKMEQCEYQLQAEKNALTLYLSDNTISFQTMLPRLWSAPSPESPEYSLFGRYAVENGLLTLAPSVSLFSNNSIKKNDNAKLWLTLTTSASHGDEVYILNHGIYPSLWRWLWDNAVYFLGMLAVTLILLLWHFMPRFGAIRPRPEVRYHPITDLLQASGDYYLHNKMYGALLTPLREEASSLLQPFHLQYPDIDSVPVLASAVSGMDISQLTHAFEAQSINQAQLTVHIKTLSQLIQQLRSVNRYTSRR